ncbi:hypothetical protein GCM10020000_31760 [Streptomyces olivoverticillatus]
MIAAGDRTVRGAHDLGDAAERHPAVDLERVQQLPVECVQFDGFRFVGFHQNTVLRAGKTPKQPDPVPWAPRIGECRPHNGTHHRTEPVRCPAPSTPSPVPPG